MDVLELVRVRTVCGRASALAIRYTHLNSAYSVLVQSTAGSGDGLGGGCDCGLGRPDVRLVDRRCPSLYGLDLPFWYACCCSASEAVVHVSLRVRRSVPLDGSMSRGDKVLFRAAPCCLVNGGLADGLVGAALM